MSSLTDVIGRSGFAYPSTVTVTRTSAGTTDGYGRYVPGATSTFTLSPVGIVPAGSSLDVKPDGYSAMDMRVLYTTTQLVKLPTPDRVTIAGADGGEFAVVHVDGPYTGFDGTHWVVRVSRVTNPGEY